MQILHHFIEGRRASADFGIYVGGEDLILAGNQDPTCLMAGYQGTTVYMIMFLKVTYKCSEIQHLSSSSPEMWILEKSKRTP